jgi:dihydropteroate synthase
MTLKLPRGRTLAIENGPLVMGIINVTPDSFSDGGVHVDPRVAVESALRMEREGAELIDVGGESTRPGAEPVPATAELERVLPVIDGIRAQSDIPISIDTTKSEVARVALEHGADLVNDVSALRFDEDLAAVVRDAGVPVILMHMRGEPRTMQKNIHYDDLIGEIKEELRKRVDEARKSGIDPAQILVDPGIGFGKTFENNIEILGRLAEFREIAPVVLGASRKAFVGHYTGQPAGPGRLAGSLAAVAAGVLAGAAVVRVHDVRETVEFLKVLGPILGTRP